MARCWMPLGANLLLLTLATSPLHGGSHELRTVESAAESIRAFSDIPLKCIPPALMREAKGVAIIPHVVKAGFLVGGRFGRGVVLVRQPDGVWSYPIFVALAGGSLGGQVGIQSTDLVLIFKTSRSLDRILRGQGTLTLGADVAVAAGPVGRQAEADTDALLRAEIFSYSRSRGLFAGVSLEGAALFVDCSANASFYGLREGHPAEVLALRGVMIAAAAVARLQEELTKLSLPPPAPAVIIPPPPPIPLPGRP